MSNTKFNFSVVLECERHIAQFRSVGLLNNESPFDKTYPFIVVRLVMFFIISKILRYFLKPLKQTSYVYDLLAGIILGPSVLGLFKNYEKLKDSPNQTQFLNFGAYFALVYYVFMIAVQIDGSMILRAPRNTKIIGLTSVIIPFLIMFIPNLILNPMGFKSRMEVYLFSMQIPKTSLINLAPMLQELNLLTTELGQLALPAALINDMSLWFFLFTLILLSQIMENFFKAILPLTLVVLFTIYVIRPGMKYVVRKTPKDQPVKEIYILALLVTAGVMAFIWDSLAGGPIIGIVFFGLVVPNGPPLGSAIVERSQMFVEDFLLPFVYMAIGDMVRFHDFSMENWRAHLMYQGTIVLGYLAKVFAIMLNALAYNISVRKALSLGLLMNAGGVIQAQFYWSLWLRQRIGRALATQLVMSNLLVTLLMVPFSVLLYEKSKKLEDSITGFELSIHEALLGSSKMRVLACVESQDEVASVISLLKATNNLETSPLSLYVVHLNELVGQATPALIPHKRHRRICKHNGCVHMVNALHNYHEYSGRRADVQLLTMITPLKGMHEGISRLAQDKLIPFIILPVTTLGGRIQKLNNHNIASTSLRCRIQQQAPCTVGIFVDMGFIDKENINYTNQGLSSSNWDHHVLVIYFGGEDDREVLTYAMRVLGHPNVTVTVLRIFFARSKKVDDKGTNCNEEDRLKDEELINFFKASVVNNDTQAAYREIQVHELSQVIDVIPSLNIDYDLIMMGRRHRDFDLDEEEISVLSETPELGFFGEMVASTKFHWGKVSILIMQHCVASDRDALETSMTLEEEPS